MTATRKSTTKTPRKTSSAATSRRSSKTPPVPVTPAPLTDDPMFPPLPSAVLQTPRAREHFNRLTSTTTPSVPEAHEQPTISDQVDQLLTSQTDAPTEPVPATPTKTGRAARSRAAKPTPTPTADATAQPTRTTTRGRGRKAAPTKNTTKNTRSTTPKAAPAPEVTPPDRQPSVSSPTEPTTIPTEPTPPTNVHTAAPTNTEPRGLSVAAAFTRLDTFNERLTQIIKAFTPFHVQRNNRVGTEDAQAVATQVTREHDRILTLLRERDELERAAFAALGGPTVTISGTPTPLSMLMLRHDLSIPTFHSLLTHIHQQRVQHLLHLKQATESAERRIDQLISQNGQDIDTLIQTLTPRTLDPLNYITTLDDLLTTAMTDAAATSSALTAYTSNVQIKPA